MQAYSTLLLILRLIYLANYLYRNQHRLLMLFRLANCTSTWTEHEQKAADESIPLEASRTDGWTTRQCQEACEFDHRCAAIDWTPRIQTKCRISINLNHRHESWGFATHYDLVSRCNVSTGQSYDYVSFR